MLHVMKSSAESSVIGRTESRQSPILHCNKLRQLQEQLQELNPQLCALRQGIKPGLSELAKLTINQ
jgi:hypothetical protein